MSIVKTKDRVEIFYKALPQKRTLVMLRRIIITLAGTAALFPVLIGTGVAAETNNRPHTRYFGEPLAWSNTGDPQCRVVGAISHRCYSFTSDATWPQGIRGNRYGNGG